MEENKAKILADIAKELRRENDGEVTDEILALEAGAKALYSRKDRDACAALLALGTVALAMAAVWLAGR